MPVNAPFLVDFARSEVCSFQTKYKINPATDIAYPRTVYIVKTNGTVQYLA